MSLAQLFSSARLGQDQNARIVVSFGERKWGVLQSGVSRQKYQRVQETLALSDETVRTVRKQGNLIELNTNGDIQWYRQQTISKPQSVKGLPITVEIEAFEQIPNPGEIQLTGKTFSEEIILLPVSELHLRPATESISIVADIEVDSIKLEEDVLTVLKILEGTEILYSNGQRNQFLQELSNLTGLTRKSVPPRRRLHYRDLRAGQLVLNPKTSFVVGPEPQGRRCFLVILNGVWLFFPAFEKGPPELSLISELEFPHQQTILDGYWIETQNSDQNSKVFVTTDSLFIEGRDVRSEKIIARMMEGQRIVKILNGSLDDYEFVSWSFRDLTDPTIFFWRMNQLLDEMPFYPYSTRGLLFIPGSIPYDFYFDPRKKNLSEQAQVCVWEKIPSVDVRIRVTNGKTNMMVLDPRTGKEVAFQGTRNNPLRDIPDWSEYQGSIVEITVRSGEDRGRQLEIVRVRPDRSVPNSTFLAGESWDTIFDPVTEEVLRGQSSELMKKYHSRERRNLFADKTGNLVVLNARHGQDAVSWTKFQRIVVVESDPKELQELEQRLATFGLKDRTLVLNGDIDTLLGSIPEVTSFLEGSVQVLAILFGLEILSAEKVSDLATVLLNAGGHLLLRALDGDAVANVFDSPLGGPKLSEFRLGTREFRNFTGDSFELNGVVYPRFRFDDILDPLQEFGFGKISIHPFDFEILLPEPDLVYSRFITGCSLERLRNTVALPSIAYPDSIPEPTPDSEQVLQGDVVARPPTLYFPVLKPGMQLIDPTSDIPSGQKAAVDDQGDLEEKPGASRRAQMTRRAKKPRTLPMLTLKRKDLTRIQPLPYPILDRFVRLAVEGDGSCMIHAVLLGVDPLYQILEDREIRRTYVQLLRDDLADELGQPNPAGGGTFYSTVAQGMLPELAKAGITFNVFGGDDSSEFEFTYELDDLQTMFEDSGAYLGDEMIDFLSQVLQFDIWVFIVQNDRIIPISRKESGLPVVVLLANGMHYELGGRQLTSEEALTLTRAPDLIQENPEMTWIQTFFQPEDPFLESLRQLKTG